MMATKDEDEMHDEAEELRKETAQGAPEVAEHDHVADLENSSRKRVRMRLYAAAEIQNVRRRMEKEVSDARAYSASNFARDMLAIKDHLDRALAVVGEDLRADKTASQFLAGIESTARELESVFQRNGVERVKSVGDSLDPHRHQAMMEMPTTDAKPGTIVEEMQPGYVMKDRLLRPALVAVAKKPD